MKTGDLITALVADRKNGLPPGRALWRWMTAAFVVAAIALVATAGVRADFAAVALTPRVVFKLAFAVLLVLVAAGAVLRLGQPGARLGAWSVGLAAVPCLLVIGASVELVLLPSNAWVAQARGTNATWCLRMIPLLAAAPLIACLTALRQSAPTRPVLAGAVAGLLAGGVGAVLYALHCTDDSPLFVAVWYGMAVLFVSALGATAGSRFLRW
ncbi:MAG: NrsF family protein [Pseudomonadota bacterium]